MTATAFVQGSGIKVEQGGVITQLRALTEFFNVGDGKRVTREWAAEVKALTPDEKTSLCTDIVDVTGWTVTGVNA